MNPSGRFVLRLPTSLHAQLRKQALERGISLNSLCVERLAINESQNMVSADNVVSDVVSYTDSQATSSLIKACINCFAEKLEGVVLFGSVARGEATAASDADLLIVLSQGSRIERSLYHLWEKLEAAAISIKGHMVSPQFVALPASSSQFGGLWYEVALDGILLWDCKGAVAKALVFLRHQMLNGMISRHETHGHPYWIRNPKASHEQMREQAHA
ncbi:MAG: nucleotidyltransferase domain-containing protein [Deltaproteobacteria bacterium]|nr:nucleotidyltransferase domain-containing protein [Deltaproteobacteria bacterium]